MKEELPAAFVEFEEIAQRLENHYLEMQDMEFTIQDGTLYMLQTRNGKRTGAAAIKMAVDMVEEKLIDKKTALLRVEPNRVELS